LRCSICSIWKRKETAEPGLEELEAFFIKNRISWLNLTGGEIFLREDLQEVFPLMGRTLPCLAYLSFPTSGYRVRETVQGVECALKATLSKIYVTVSFDGGRRAHESLRRAEGSFDRAKETFIALKKIEKKTRGRLGVAPGMTLSAELLQYSENPVEDLIEDLGLDGAHELHVNLAHSSRHYYGNPKLQPLPSEIPAALLNQLIRSRRFGFSGIHILERLYLKGARRYLRTGRSPLPCQACAASVFIDGNWSVFPCTVFSKPLGDLRSLNYDLSRLASTRIFTETRADIAAGACPGCWTPCEAYTAILGMALKPPLLRLALSL
jgi:MoaA/NifB/PqqE/SkfB family radical SAM enzyme